MKKLNVKKKPTWYSMAVVPNEDYCRQSHPLMTQCRVVFAWNGSRVDVYKRKTDPE